jgi:2-desacetyl-2-hydroxyethyl bacteriochlorophyllide A dehydrogenase
MKAVVVKGPGVLEVQDVPEPEPKADEIKVKIAYAGICGSDPKIVDAKGASGRPEGAIGWPKKPMPKHDGVMILGHEASGTIVKIGKDVKGDFKIGQRVAMNFRNYCGACYYCANGMENFCERVTMFWGLMAEYAVFKEGLVFPLPEDLPLDVGAFLEPVTVAVHAIDIARMKVGDTVIITGGGTIGLLILQLAIKSGASKILVSEPIAEKRQLAKQLGADVVVDPLKENLLDISNKLTDGRGFNVCFEASGIPAIARQLILLSEACGSIVWAATYPSGVDVGVPIEYVYFRELSIHSVFLSPYSFPRAVQMLPKLDLKPLITVFPLQEAVKAFEAHKKGRDIKIMLQP